MAISSGLYYITWRDALQNVLAIDFDLETHKGAIFTDTLVPAHDTATLYGTTPYDANETSGGAGWPAGGVVLVGTTFSVEAGSLMTYDGTDVSQTPTDITSGMGYVLYADALLNELLVMIDFVTAVTTVAGQLDITWTAPGSGGVYNVDMVP